MSETPDDRTDDWSPRMQAWFQPAIISATTVPVRIGATTTVGSVNSLPATHDPRRGTTCADADRAADEQIDGLSAECERLRGLLKANGIGDGESDE